MPDLDTIKQRLRQLIVDGLHLEGVAPESIEDDAPLFGDGLGLDSVDALEIMVIVEKEYGIKIDGQAINPADFASLNQLAGFVQRLEAERSTSNAAR